MHKTDNRKDKKKKKKEIVESWAKASRQLFPTSGKQFPSDTTVKSKESYLCLSPPTTWTHLRLPISSAASSSSLLSYAFRLRLSRSGSPLSQCGGGGGVPNQTGEAIVPLAPPAGWRGGN